MGDKVTPSASPPKMVKKICHVCGKEKKPYTVFLKNDIFSLLKYEQAREDGAICERCDRYFAMTGEFKDASEEEFKIAKKSVWFANMLLKWWEKYEKMSEDKDNKRDIFFLPSWGVKPKA